MNCGVKAGSASTDESMNARLYPSTNLEYDVSDIGHCAFRVKKGSNMCSPKDYLEDDLTNNQ